ncbi:MAG: hypothetical protein ABEJ66_01415, partial [Candidatus Nanohaloarchaea archaeon]
MKFQLFGRLRDGNESEDSAGGSSTTGEQGPGGTGPGGGGSLGGSGLQKTVENMFSQGYSEDEIRQELQGQYPDDEIDQALNKAVADTATRDSSPSGGPEPMSTYQGNDDAVSPVDEGFSREGNDTMNDQPGPQDQQQGPQPPPQQQSPDNSPQQASQGGVQPAGDVEELVETIVAENLDRVETEFENVYREIDELKEQVDDLEQRVHDLEVRDDEDQEQFVQKVEEMEDHIDSYQSRIGGLEKAFQQVLPSLVDNVR